MLLSVLSLSFFLFLLILVCVCVHVFSVPLFYLLHLHSSTTSLPPLSPSDCGMNIHKQCLQAALRQSDCIPSRKLIKKGNHLHLLTELCN